MKIWTVANQKGGVGKTTTAVTLAGFLAGRGQRTLLVDLDPHGSLTSYFGYNPDTIEESVYSLFHRETADSNMPLAAMLRKTGVPRLDLLPACTALVALDRQIGAQQGMGLVIQTALRDYQTHYPYVIIDCPPTLGVLMINALAACDLLILPVQTEFLAINGLERMLNTLKMIILSGKESINYLILPTMYDQRTRASRDCLEYLQNGYAGNIHEAYIPIDTNFREASRHGRPLSVMAPRSRGAVAYAALLSTLTEADQFAATGLEEAG
ncbi:MAG: ParA family protein [Gammaproteobacteria bacterium]